MSPRSKEISEEMRAQSSTALIRAARKLFAEKGYFNCRISEIAQESGMSQGNVYWYFSSKEALLKAVLADDFNHLGAAMQTAAAGSGNASEKIETMMDNLIKFVRERGEFVTIILSLLGHGGSDLFAKMGFDMIQIGTGYTQSVATILAQGQEEGLIPANLDPQTQTMFFFGLFNGLNLTYGQDWLALPPEVINSATMRLLGIAQSEEQA